jgi:hypothetical protein
MRSRAYLGTLGLCAVIGSAAMPPSAQAGVPKRDAAVATKAALHDLAASMDGHGVHVQRCVPHGETTRCRASIRGARQTVRALVAVQDGGDTWSVRLIRLSVSVR